MNVFRKHSFKYSYLQILFTPHLGKQIMFLTVFAKFSRKLAPHLCIYSNATEINGICAVGECAQPIAKEISDEPEFRVCLPLKLALLRIFLSVLMSVNKH
uniref:Uncharacterized protein n=1 Tax=Micrurus corallinus TaxID=54390 RepID=A0A2D4FZC9_MICCO